MAVLALLPGARPALASPTPPAPNPALIGTWVSANPNAGTNGLPFLIIESAPGGGLLVDPCGHWPFYGCAGGLFPATVYGATVSSTTGNSFQVNVTLTNFPDSLHEVLLGTYRFPPHGVPELTVQEFTNLKPSPNSDTVITETFVPFANPMIPGLPEAAATGYPAGNPVQPAASLLGTWNSTSQDGGIATIVAGTNPDGSLNVHAFGTCSPANCDLGAVNAIMYATSDTATPGTTFLAPYSFGFENDLLSGTVNADGNTLTVSTYTEFTDGGGRGNYMMTDTFTRG
jgi:hypothetical protein